MSQEAISFHLLAKPAGATCNLDCKYCFFLSKDRLYPSERTRMTDEVLEAYIRQRLSQHNEPEINIAWQGGEPTIMGLEFFRRAVALTAKYRKPEQQILHTIQTNGLLLDDDWCAFLKQHNFLVGLSIDGPREMHDAYRVDKRGGGSYDLVMRAWERLQRYGVDCNILCTVHAANSDHPLDVYRFFRDQMGATFLQFIPIVERVTKELLPVANKGWGERPGGERPLYRQRGSLVTDRSVRAEQFGQFLCEIFDEWVKHDVGKVFVQTFDVALGSWLGQHNLCIFSPTCGNALALEHNGDVYSCDHYVEPDYLLGNIKETPLLELVTSDQQRAFGQHKLDSLPRYCRDCEVLFACYGECPRNRFIQTPDGEPGLNYLCAGYKRFFTHIDPSMRVMADLIRHGRYADEIMQMGPPASLPSEEIGQGADLGRNRCRRH
jgi:uncharacterized protein